MFESLIKELAQNGSVRFYVRARPDASATKAVAVLDDESVKVDIAAPAEKGKANKELVRYLADEFEVSMGDVRIVSGESNRMKFILIAE